MSFDMDGAIGEALASVDTAKTAIRDVQGIVTRNMDTENHWMVLASGLEAYLRISSTIAHFLRVVLEDTRASARQMQLIDEIASNTFAEKALEVGLEDFTDVAKAARKKEDG